jgi:dihydroxy-acid dehydratase
VSVFEGVGAHMAGTIDDARLEELEAAGCPTCGSCSGMFTANSMNCLCEALGVALPGNGTLLATDPGRLELARRRRGSSCAWSTTGCRSSTWSPPRPSTTPSPLDMAMGGSTNTVLHVLALAREAGVDYPLARFNEVAERVPHLTKVSPAWDGDRQWHIEDVHAAGGVPAVLGELAALPGVLHLDAPTVLGDHARRPARRPRHRRPGGHPAGRRAARAARRAVGAVRLPRARRRGHQGGRRRPARDDVPRSGARVRRRGGRPSRRCARAASSPAT